MLCLLCLLLWLLAVYVCEESLRHVCFVRCVCCLACSMCLMCFAMLGALVLHVYVNISTCPPSQKINRSNPKPTLKFDPSNRNSPGIPLLLPLPFFTPQFCCWQSWHSSWPNECRVRRKSAVRSCSLVEDHFPSSHVCLVWVLLPGWSKQTCVVRAAHVSL